MLHQALQMHRLRIAGGPAPRTFCRVAEVGPPSLSSSCVALSFFFFFFPSSSFQPFFQLGRNNFFNVLVGKVLPHRFADSVRSMSQVHIGLNDI